MARDWLLVETLGDEPVVVALGRQLRNLVPLTDFLRRNPRLAAIQAAIAESLQNSQSLVSITPKSDRVIRAEPVLMSDGRMHGVHIWSGPATAEPPERPIPGPLKWDMTLRVATDTPESLANTGRNLEVEKPEGRAFADSWPSGDLKPNEAKALAAVVGSEPGQTLCDTWDSTDWQGNHIRVSLVARNGLEPGPDGRDHVIARGMNWRAVPVEPVRSTDQSAEGIVQGITQPGVHRALFDLGSFTLLKWLDEPCPFYDWRRIVTDAPPIHPRDEAKVAAMAAEFAGGATSGVLRMPGHDGGWVPVHVSANLVEVEQKTFAGLVSLRLPTASELAEAGLTDPDPTDG
jgi:triple sensor domain protein